MDAADIASLIAAAGGGAILLELTKRGLDKLSNRGAKRRDEVDRAWRRADREAHKRRMLEEYASHLRRILISAACIEAADIPNWPAYSSTDTNTSKETT